MRNIGFNVLVNTAHFHLKFLPASLTGFDSSRNNCSFEKVEDDALRYTRKLLVENWKAIWMVAIAMRQRRWLTFEDICQIISCAEGKVPNDVVAQELARGNEKDRIVILNKWENAFTEYSIQ